MKAVILAAGYSTRLGGITADTPKALLSVAGKPMLTHLTEKIWRSGVGFDEIIVVSNSRFLSQIKAWAQGLEAPVTVLDDGSTSVETALGALGDFSFALSRIGIPDDVFLSVGDNFFDFGLDEFFNAYISRGKQPLIMARRISDIELLKRIAVASVDDKHMITKMVEKPSEPFSDIGVFGLYMYPKKAVELLSDYFESGGSRDQPGRFPAWLYERLSLYAYFAPGDIYDIGTPESLADVRAAYGG